MPTRYGKGMLAGLAAAPDIVGRSVHLDRSVALSERSREDSVSVAPSDHALQEPSAGRPALGGFAPPAGVANR
jgi:hypothetical protein